MARLTEDLTKDLLRKHGVRVPRGVVVTSSVGVEDILRTIGPQVVVKALVPAGRRGKAGAVQKAATAPDAQRIIDGMLGTKVHGHVVRQALVEQAIPIAHEFYAAFTFGPDGARVLASSRGGVDIEETHGEDPGAIVGHSVDHGTGLRRYHCVDLWRRAGVRGTPLVGLSDFTLRLWETFRDLDGFMLEVNPLAVDERGDLWAVGAMFDIDDAAMFRHPDLSTVPLDAGPGWREPTIRERAVGEANRASVGGRVRYIELEGEIGLFVAGGGAGLMIHDLLIAFGGRPANHTDITPGRSPDKLSAVFDAIFTQPHVKSLLVCVNYLQMVRADVILEALVHSVASHRIDAERFPIVVRVFGPGEDHARTLASQVPGIRYLPHGTDIEDAIRLIVDLSAHI